MKELLIGITNVLRLAYWVEIVTNNPRCTYYFGPFINETEAKAAKYGYIEDLQNEGAQGIVVTIKRCKPKELTIFDELGEVTEISGLPTLSSQLS